MSEIKHLRDQLLKKILASLAQHDKLEVLNGCSEVISFIKKSALINEFLKNMMPDSQIVIKSILALGQGPNVFNQLETLTNPFLALQELIDPLLEVEKFYSSIGGVIGYYCTAIDLIEKKTILPCDNQNELFHQPPYIDISHNTKEVQKSIADGIRTLPHMAEIYPLGGAGDRLDLREEVSGEPLPAAYLPFGGMTLLEGLIADLQAKEYLYWKLYGKQILTPVAMMTSKEKNNQALIIEICQSKNWFGRPADSFKTFMQPLVPVICVTGDFSLSAPLKMTFKPGGHGVIWKLAQDEGIFTWLKGLNRKKILVRQINNPVAGTDYGVIAFTGIGSAYNKAFGVASCPRLLNAAEGMLLQVEKTVPGAHQYYIKNVEYTDFKASGLTDCPAEKNCPFSLYPANTNILFVDIQAVQEALKIDPLPGKLINLKHQVPCLGPQGEMQAVFGGRVESMMQNIAESIVDINPQTIRERDPQQFKSFVTYNQRVKTISVTKNQISKGKSFLETPEACLFDRLSNCYDLLVNYCGCKMPPIRDLEGQIKEGPSFMVTYHPALGPLYQILAQKVRGGAIAEKSELLLNIAELDMFELSLEGSLRITSIDILGEKNEKGMINYSLQSGKCELINVHVVNKGINWKGGNIYWSNKISHHEKLEIVLHGNAEFFAEGVTFSGSHRFEIPQGWRMELRMNKGEIEQMMLPISSPTWYWKYSIDDAGSIAIEKVFPGEHLNS